MQDGGWQDEMIGMQGFDNPHKWHAELIEAWETQLPAKMEEAIAGNIDQLGDMQMLGMARLLLKSLVQKKIRDLSATYLTLSFAEIAEKTKLQQEVVEPTLQEMIKSKSITARINKKQNTVDFIGDDADEDEQLVSPQNYEMIKTVE